MRRLVVAVWLAGTACGAQTLAVHPGPAERPVQLPRGVGEERLMDLCLLSEVEDAWVYYEEGGSGWWLDVGLREGPDEVLIDVPWSRLTGAGEIAVYHIHPALADVVRAARRYRPMAHGAEETFRSVVLGETPGLFARAPGRTDWLGAVELRRRARESGLEIDTRVVVAAGVWDYGGRPAADLGRTWPYLDFEGYVRPEGRERMVAAFAARGLELEFDDRRALGETELFRQVFARTLRRYSSAWNPEPP